MECKGYLPLNEDPRAIDFGPDRSIRLQDNLLNVLLPCTMEVLFLPTASIGATVKDLAQTYLKMFVLVYVTSVSITNLVGRKCPQDGTRAESGI